MPLERPPKYTVETEPRRRPDNVKQRIVRERKYKNIRLVSEQVAEFEYKPARCSKSYRMVVLRKNLSVERGENVLFPDIRYFFYITNDLELPASGIVFESNARCNQENLIEQLKNGVKALRTPLDSLESNWAYMVMASLAWTLKCWFALLLPEAGLWSNKYRAEKTTVLHMEFKKFVDYFMLIPAGLARTGRRLVVRLLSWNPLQHILLRAIELLETRMPLRC